MRAKARASHFERCANGADIREERENREGKQTTAIRVHNHITFRVWHVISFLSPLWKTKITIRLHITARVSSS